MVEPIAVIGGIAAVGQLAKYGFQLMRAMNDRPRNLGSISQTVTHLMNYLDWHTNFLRSLSTRPGASSVQVVIDRSHCTALLLQGILKSFAIERNDSRTTRVRKCLRYQRKQRRVAMYLADLERCELILNAHFSL